MKDEEYLFRQTERERKRNSYGAKSRVTHGGAVRFPSDYMTRKEREALNGETKTYEMGKPVKWAVFREWPDDIKRHYIEGVTEKFGATTKAIADMMGVHEKTLSLERQRLGVQGKKGVMLKDAAKWEAFLAEARGMVATGNGKSDEEKQTIAALIAALAGTGAKLTIEVTL